MTLILDVTDRALVLAVPLFGEIEAETVFWLLDGAVTSAYPNGGMLFAKGDRADRFFIVLDGRVNLFALTESGDQSIIETISRGHSFAEGAIFASGLFPLNAEMAEGTRLLEIPAPIFLKRLAERPGLIPKLLASLARWQRRLMAELGDLKGRSPVQRLGSFLLALADGVVSQPGRPVTVVSPLAKTELASRIGITPESLSRALSRLKPIGIVSQGRSFTIEDLGRLRRFCGE